MVIRNLRALGSNINPPTVSISVGTHPSASTSALGTYILYRYVYPQSLGVRYCPPGVLEEVYRD